MGTNIELSPKYIVSENKDWEKCAITCEKKCVCMVDL